MTVLEEYDSLPARITDAAEHVRDLDGKLRAERERRDDLIAQAHDHAGLTVAQVARAAQISKPQVIRILSRSSDDG